jgi:hypothetical protein
MSGSDHVAGGAIAPIYMNETDYAYLSDSAKAQVDASVSRILTEAYDSAYKILTENNKGFKNLSEALIEFETLGKEEINLAIAGKRKEIKRLREEESRNKLEEKQQLTQHMYVTDSSKS